MHQCSLRRFNPGGKSEARDGIEVFGDGRVTPRDSRNEKSVGRDSYWPNKTLPWIDRYFRFEKWRRLPIVHPSLGPGPREKRISRLCNV